MSRMKSQNRLPGCDARLVNYIEDAYGSDSAPVAFSDPRDWLRKGSDTYFSNSEKKDFVGFLDCIKYMCVGRPPRYNKTCDTTFWVMVVNTKGAWGEFGNGIKDHQMNEVWVVVAKKGVPEDEPATPNDMEIIVGSLDTDHDNKLVMGNGSLSLFVPDAPKLAILFRTVTWASEGKRHDCNTLTAFSPSSKKGGPPLARTRRNFTIKGGGSLPGMCADQKEDSNSFCLSAAYFSDGNEPMFVESAIVIEHNGKVGLIAHKTNEWFSAEGFPPRDTPKWGTGNKQSTRADQAEVQDARRMASMALNNM